MLNDRRSRLWSLVAPAVVLLFLSGSSVALSASPDPTAPSPSPSVSADPSASPSPGESPSPSAGIFCPSPTVYEAGFEVARGGTFKVRFDGFSANTPVTVVFVDWSRGDVQRPMGTSMSDGQGRGTVAGVVPRDAPIGEVILYVVAEDACSSNSYFTVLGSPRAASIDDDIVVPGQRVTVRAGGLPRRPTSFCRSTAARRKVNATLNATGSGALLDVGGRDGRDPCADPPRHLAGSTSAMGEWSVAGHDLRIQLGVEITVVAGGTLPPTDTEAGR